MEASKKTAVLEITNDSAKFAIGYAIGGAPVIIYRTEKSCRGMLSDGLISDRASLVALISQFAHIEDEAFSLRINAQNLSIIVPPLGLQIYQNTKMTTVASSAASPIIGQTDINNLTMLLVNDSIPNGNVVVDIIPDSFGLDNGKEYSNPPLGEKSRTISIRAKMHTLPASLAHDYRSLVEEAGFRIKDLSVAPYCASQLLMSDKSMPESYLLLDMGARLTTITIVGATAPFSSLFFPKGGDHLTEAIASSMGLAFQDAENLKAGYGFDERATKFEAPIVVVTGKDGKKSRFFQKSLNAVIENYFEDYNAHLSNAIARLLSRQPASATLSAMPLVAIGGASQLKGLGKLLAPSLGARKFIAYTPLTVGCRDPRFANVLGLIYAESHYRGSLDEMYRGVSTLSRERQ